MLNKKKIFIFCSFLIFIIIIMGFLFNGKVKDNGILNIKYKVASGTSWSRYYKNGSTASLNGDNLTGIKIKMNKKYKYSVYTSLFYNDVWSNQMSIEQLNKSKINKPIYGMKLSTTSRIFKDYSICYRTYNSKDHWLNWVCNGEITGNIKYPIKKVEIKIIPNNVIFNEYLKDYDVKDDINVGF